MVVRSESSERVVDSVIQLCPEPASPSSPSEGAQLRDALKKGSKRIFPLYDNFSRSVKRHREKSREREKSRDRVRQRERVKLKEEEERVIGRNSANLAGEDAEKAEKVTEEDRGREKSKEKRRFYQRDKSKEKKKNKDKSKISKAESETPLELRGINTKDVSRPSSTCSGQEELIYGQIERLENPASTGTLAGVTTSSMSSSDLTKSCETTSQTLLSTCHSTPALFGFAERSVDVPTSVTSPSAPSTSSTHQLTRVPESSDYGTYYGGVPGCRRGLYESPLGKYGSFARSYFTLERSGARRSSDHDYETFETVLAETAKTWAVTKATNTTVKENNQGELENVTGNVESGTGYSIGTHTTSDRAKHHTSDTEIKTNASELQQLSTKSNRRAGALGLYSIALFDGDVTHSDVTDEVSSAADLPGTACATTEPRGLTGVQSAEPAVSAELDGEPGSVSVPSETSCVATEGALIQSDNLAADRRDTAAVSVSGTAASQLSTADGVSVAQCSADGTCATRELTTVDKVKSSRRFLSFQSRATSKSVGKAAAKKSFLNNLLRTGDDVADPVVETPETLDRANTSSLPAKYRDIFSERRSSRPEQRAQRDGVSSAIKSEGRCRESSVSAQSSSSEVVEIELPGVFGPSQMRASLRITLKNNSNSRVKDEKDNVSLSDKTVSNKRASDQAVVRRSSRSRSRSQPRRTPEQRMSITIPPATVAALTNKFNALIQATSAESSPSPTGIKTFNLGSITLDKSGNVSKSSSFRRTDTARGSSRRRCAAERTETQSRDSTDALVNRASDVLSREIAGLIRAGMVSGNGGSRSGPGSFRTGKDGTGKVSSSVPESCSAVSSRAASFRRVRGSGASLGGGSRDSGRVSSRRKHGDPRNGGNRIPHWTSAVRAELKKNTLNKANLSSSSDKPSNVCQDNASVLREGNVTGDNSNGRPNTDDKTTVSKVSLTYNKEKQGSPNADVLSNKAGGGDVLNACNPAREESKNAFYTASHDTSPTSKSADWAAQKLDNKTKTETTPTTETRASSLKKSSRQSIDINRVYDRELRKITNSGTVAKASELWLKRAQSNSELVACKRDEAGLTHTLSKKTGVGGNAPAEKVADKTIPATEDSKKTSKESDTISSPGNCSTPVSSLTDERTSNRTVSKTMQETVQKTAAEEPKKDTALAQTGAESSTLGTAESEHKRNTNSEGTCAKETYRTHLEIKRAAEKKNTLQENRTYEPSPLAGVQKKPCISMFENKLYGATFTPIKESINKYVAVASRSGIRSSTGSQTLNRNTHTPAGKSLSLRSLPSGSPVSRVKEAIHRFETPAPTNASAVRTSPDEAARKSTTLPSRLPTSAAPAAPEGHTPAFPHSAKNGGGLGRGRGFYESIWNGRREYKPNESFLWHGCSQLTSGGESAGSATSSFSNSDRDTASSLSDASSAADDDPAARARGSLWRRLGLTRSGPAAEPPHPAGEYEPTGGSSSSGTVTYDNGSDPGYERIGGGDSCVGYEQIGGSSASSSSRYERIGAPPPPPSETTSAGYETLAPPSDTSTLCYDDCVVPARLAVVSEHQAESLGYLESGSSQYEDIGGVWSTSTEKGAGPPPHDYLRLPPLQTCAEEREDAEGSECGPQTVNSYQLTEFDGVADQMAAPSAAVKQVAAPSGQQASLPSTPRARNASDRDTGGEWTDIDADGEQEASDDTEERPQSPIVVTRPHFVRMRNRSRRFSKTRAGRRSWSQSLRNLNSHAGEQEQIQQEGPWRHTLNGGETDEEWLDDNHLYEALDSHYEHVEVLADAADSDEAADDDDKDLCDEDLDPDQHTNGMQKIAEGMRKRLQKTKSGIRSGIIRFRKSTSASGESPVAVGGKPRWSLKKHLPRKKSYSMAGTPPGGDSSKFYLNLDLVIQPGQEEEGRRTAGEEEGEARSESDPGSNRSSVRRSDTDSLHQADSRTRLPSTQSNSSQASAASLAAAAAAATIRKSSRPRTAPPAPPAPLPAASANSPPHQARSHESSSSPGFARSLSTHSQPSPRTLAAFRRSSVDADVAPPLPPPAARGTRPPSILHQHSCSDLSEHVSRPRLERGGASLGGGVTSLGDVTTGAGHDNTEYMLSSAAQKAAREIEEEEEPYTSLREREPLYQVYLRDRCYQDSVSGSSEDDYETIREASPDADCDVTMTSSTEIGNSAPPPPPPPARRRVTSRPSALQLLSSPTEGQRSLWCHLPEVIASGLLERLTSEQKRLQEAMFEVISSEASYQKSLSVLVHHFQEESALCQFQSPDCVIKKADHQDLFSSAEKVRQSSESFLTDLERRWQENVTLEGLCDVILCHANTNFHVYKQYCANQTVQDRKLKELREKNPAFVEVLRRLESSSQCQSLSLHSFLMLPMQRVTRLPLLVSAILVRLEPGHPEYNSCQRAYQTLTKLVKDCNEEARRHERLEELVSISRQLVFKDIKQFPLVTPSRWLVKKGELLRTIYKAEDSKMTFGRKQSRQQTVHVFLFNDLLVISKKKSDDSYVVLDWCLRNMVQLTENAEDRTDKFLLTLLSNHEGRTVEMLFSCPLESERVRWVEAVTPRTQKSDTETVYETWDCPQVQAMHPYAAQQPDEITLHVGDVLKVLRKVPDGWYQGMRLADSSSGWFPSNRCREIMSEHVRARHLRQRYEVLRITGDFLRQERERKLKDPGKGGSPPSDRSTSTWGSPS